MITSPNPADPSLSQALPEALPLAELIRSTHSVVSLPEVYYRVQSLLEDPDHDLGTLARVIEADTGLTARLLRAVNSPLYGLSRRVDRISHAIALLGSQAIRDIVLATSVARIFSRLPARLVDISTFWHHSIYCALIAKQLAPRCRILHGERMAVAGILHDIGQLVLYRIQPVLAAEALARAEPADDGAYLAERQVFGYTHAEVGAELLKAWRLPESLQETLRNHHEPREDSGYALESAILHLANSIANREEPGRSLPACEPRIAPTAWAITGLTEEVIDPVLSEASAAFLETLDMLLPGKPYG